MIVVYLDQWSPKDDLEKVVFLAIVKLPDGISKKEVDDLVSKRWSADADSMTDVLRWVYLPVMTVNSEYKIVEANDE